MGLSGPTVAIPVTPRVTAASPPTQATGSPGWSNPDSELQIEYPNLASPPAATATLAGPETASLDLTGFPSNAFPAGSEIKAVTLRAVHRESAGVTAQATLSVDNQAIAVTPAPAFVGWRADVTDRFRFPRDPVDNKCPVVDPDDITKCAVDPAKLQGLHVIWAASLAAGTGDAALDGLTIEVSYTAPRLRAKVAFAPGPTIVAWTVLR